MKAVRLLIILSLIFCCLLTVCSCDGIEALPAPSNVEIDEATLDLSWKTVKDARLYTIRIEFESGEVIIENDPEILNTIPLTASNVETIRRAMRNVIHGSSAANNVYVNFRDAKYEAGGKTGTAQAGSNASNNAWFTGFAPATDPEIVVTCMIEHGSSGGNSSFTVRKVMDAYLLSAE